MTDTRMEPTVPIELYPREPAIPVNDREYAVWEHGRRQGHAEAARAARQSVPHSMDCESPDCPRKPKEVAP